MPRIPRAQDATCAICIESLFNTRDDLDDVLPIATPDCGHVFHEKCLMGWFKAQSEQYLAQIRAHDPDYRRGASPSASEAPALCPTCRTECYADPETGEPSVHRLFINFGEDGMGNSSSQMGSSPVRWSTGGGGGSSSSSKAAKEKEREVMGMARRAKGLAEEVKGYEVGSDEDEVQGTLRRVEGLKEDAVSVKALSGVKTYIGGLTVALNNLRSSLERNPLTTTLQNRIADMNAEKNALTAQLHQLRTVGVPAAVLKAVKDEQARGERATKRVRDEMELIRRELEKEQVARRATRREREEREKEVEKKVEDMKSQLAKEVAERESLNETLRDRTKALRLLQAKAESRKEMKKELEALQAENARLKVQSASTSTRTATQKRSHPEDGVTASGSRASSPLLADSSIEEIPMSLLRPAMAKPRPPTADESLLVDLPSFGDASGYSAAEASRSRDPSPYVLHSRGNEAGSSGRAHPTARTFSFDLETGLPRVNSKKRKDSSKSKYFRDDDEDDWTEADHANDVLIPATSPVADRLASPPKRSRTNPFTTTKHASDQRRVLQSSSTRTAAKEMDIIDVTSDRSSPARSANGMSPLRASRAANRLGAPFPRPVNGNLGTSLEGTAVASKSGKTGVSGQKSMVEFLGVADKNGRPGKGVVSGAKVKRRA